MSVSTKQYVDLYSQTKELLNNHSSSLLNGKREKAIQDFESLGLPTQKLEDFKYTNVEKYFEPNFGVNLKRLTIPANPEEVFSCDVPDLDTVQSFMINDAFYPTIKKESLLPKGVLYGSLKTLSEEHHNLLEKFYGKLADTSKDAVSALNTALAQDGVLLYVPKNVVVETPIQLIDILRADVDLMYNRRLLIIIEANAQAKLLVCNHAVDNVNFLGTHVTEIFVGDNAHFDYYELEETHTKTARFNNIFVKQEANSNVLVNNMTLHNGVTRNTTDIILAGEGAHIDCHGMAIEDKNQHVDNATKIDHAVPNCTSNELFKNVLDDHATGAFTGMILVRPDAQKTNSQQTNRNICLTNDARMNARPQLEIYADDVRCGHGATVGQLDETALFYMRARGIAEREGKLLLMFAFVNEVIDTISIEALKERLHILVEKRFRGELGSCSGCAHCNK